MWVRLYDTLCNWTMKNKSMAGLIWEVLSILFHDMNTKIVHASVVFQLDSPLILGRWYRKENVCLIWVDFHHEKLPFFCFTMGRLEIMVENV